MKKIGKIGEINKRANQILKWIYIDYGIDRCELKFPGCKRDSFLSFAHKERREKYRKTPELLSDFNQTLLACVHCHSILDDRSKTTEAEKNAIFNRLRPKKMQDLPEDL